MKVAPEAFADPGDDPFEDTGFISLRAAMGGGPRRGRVIEVFGPEGAGKTTLAVQLAAQNLGHGECALFEDHEHTFSPEYVKIYSGIDVVHLHEAKAWFKKHGEKAHPPVFLWTQPEHLEDGCDLANAMVESFGPKLRHVIMDSVASMTPKVMDEKSTDHSHVAVRARRLNNWLEPAVGKYHKNGTTLWMVNQVRDVIDGGGFSELSKVTTPGGRALKFYSTHRLYVKDGYSRRWGTLLGQDSKASQVICCKNKVSPTRVGRCQLVLAPGLGFSRDIELLDLCEEYGVLTPGGPGKFQFQGKGPYTRVSLLKALWDEERGYLLFQALENALRNVAFAAQIQSGELTVEELPGLDLSLWQDQFKPKTGTIASSKEDARIAVLDAVLHNSAAANDAVQSDTSSFLAL